MNSAHSLRAISGSNYLPRALRPEREAAVPHTRNSSRIPKPRLGLPRRRLRRVLAPFRRGLD